MGGWHHNLLVDSHKSLVDSHKSLLESHTYSLSHAQNVAAADMLRVSQYGEEKVEEVQSQIHAVALTFLKISPDLHRLGFVLTPIQHCFDQDCFWNENSS